MDESRVSRLSWLFIWPPEDILLTLFVLLNFLLIFSFLRDEASVWWDAVAVSFCLAGLGLAGGS